MKEKIKTLSFATRAIHCGQEPDPLTGAVTVPILSNVHLRSAGNRRAQRIRILPCVESYAHAP